MIQDTSLDAYEEYKPNAAAMRAMVMLHLEECGETGATDEEMSIVFGTEKTQSNRPRRVALVQDGAVRDSGKRRLTRSDRKAIVWVWVPPEERFAEAKKVKRAALVAALRQRVARLSYPKLKVLALYLSELEGQPEVRVPEGVFEVEEGDPGTDLAPGWYWLNPFGDPVGPFDDPDSAGDAAKPPPPPPPPPGPVLPARPALPSLDSQLSLGIVIGANR